MACEHEQRCTSAWAYFALVWAAVWKAPTPAFPVVPVLRKCEKATWETVTGEKEWDGSNWASLESFLRLPAAGLVLWAVHKSDGIPFRNLTLDCTCAAFQEPSCWQTLRESFRFKLDHTCRRMGFPSRPVQAGLALVFLKKKNPTGSWRGEEYKPLCR